jgi:predicted transcriptional regulator
VKEGIEEGERDIAEGKIHTYEEVRKLFNWK